MDLRPQRTTIEGPIATPRAEAAYRVEPEPSWIDISQILGGLRRNIWLILVITTMTVGAAAYLVSGEPNRYIATATIRLIDRTPGMETSAPTELPLGGEIDPLASEMMVLKGRTVVGMAVDREGFRLFSTATFAPANFVEVDEISLEPDKSGRVHLDLGEDGVTYGQSSNRRTVAYGEPIVVEGARFTVPARPALSGSVVLSIVTRDVAIDYLLSELNADLLSGTGGIVVSFTSGDPDVPPRAVNAIVQAYQEVNADLARKNVSRRRVFLEEQLRTTDSLLMLAQAGLSGFRAREQAYSAQSMFSTEQGNLIQIEIEQARLQADLRMYENNLNRILAARASGQAADLGSIMSLPGLAGDPVAGPIYSQLIGHRTERESMVTGAWSRATTHPDVRRLDALIASAEAQLINAVQSHIASGRAQIGALGSLSGRAAARMSELPRTEVEEMHLSQNLAALQQMGDLLRDQYQAVRLEEAAEAGLVEIVQLSTRSLPITVSPWNKLFLGLVAGLMLGGGIALIREKMDHSINRPEEIEEYLLVPNLAVIPQAKPYLLESGSNGDGDGPSGSLDPPGAEAYRILRANLLFSEGRLKTLVITSAAPGEGKTMTAANLSAAIARQGLRVLLMECDLRRPSLTRYFKSKDGIDLSDVVLNKRAWREAIHPSEIPGLDLLLTAHAIPQAAEYLAGAEMRDLLAELSAQYDMVILDTSPLLVAADATVLGAIVDGVLLVVRTTRTNREAVQQAVNQLGLVGARVVGTVLNDPDGSVARYGSYYDYSAAYEGE